jgi:hypothetical protein
MEWEQFPQLSTARSDDDCFMCYIFWNCISRNACDKKYRCRLCFKIDVDTMSRALWQVLYETQWHCNKHVILQIFYKIWCMQIAIWITFWNCIPIVHVSKIQVSLMFSILM